MILVETEVGPHARRSRSLELGRHELGASRDLEPGDVVVVRSGQEHWTACVVAVEAAGAESVHRLALGGPVPAEQARALVATTGDLRAGSGDGVRAALAGADVVAMLAMLGSLRRIGRDVRVPAQRRTSGLLAGPA